MNLEIRGAKKLLIVYYLITLHIATIYFVADHLAGRYSVVPDDESADNKPKVDLSPVPTLDPSVTLQSPTPAPHQLDLHPGGLIVPVAGVSREELTDSFADARGEGRVHDAIDIPAPAGTPVLAAADGRIIKFFESEAGGTTIYQLDSTGRYVFYYAHLERRADDLKVDDEVRQGRTIGYVGDTGNAGPGNYHLHFSIMMVTDPKRYWDGEYVNPYPLLTR